MMNSALMDAIFKNLGKYILVAGALVGTQLLAAPLCVNGALLSTYENNTCSVGYIDFTFPPAGSAYSTVGTNVNDTDVRVNIVGNGLLPNAPVGLTFTPINATQWTVNDTEGEADFRLHFTAAVNNLAPLPIKLISTTLSIDSLIHYGGHCADASIASCDDFGGGTSAQVGESVIDHNSQTQFPGINMIAVGNTDSESIANGGTALTLSAPISSTAVDVDKDYLMTAFDTNSSETINSTTETFLFNSVPEPGPFVLAGAGLLVLFLVRRRKLAAGVLAVAAAAVSSGSAQAAPLCTSLSTLAQYETAGTCTFGQLNFTFNPTSLQILVNTTSGTGTTSGITTVPTAGNVTVDMTQAGSTVTANFGLVAGTASSATLDFNINYTVAAPTVKITGFAYSDAVTHGTASGTFAGSNVNVKNGATSIASDPIGNTSGGASNNFSPFLPVNTPIAVSTTFDLSSNNGARAINSTHISHLTESFNLTPEPMTTILLGSALTLFGVIGRRKSGKK